MDQIWMVVNHLSKEYEDGVDEFIRFVVDHAEDPSKVICPCLMCFYAREVHDLKDHLADKFTVEGHIYKQFMHHGPF